MDAATVPARPVQESVVSPPDDAVIRSVGTVASGIFARRQIDCHGAGGGNDDVGSQILARCLRRHRDSVHLGDCKRWKGQCRVGGWQVECAWMIRTGSTGIGIGGRAEPDDAGGRCRDYVLPPPEIAVKLPVPEIAGATKWIAPPDPAPLAQPAGLPCGTLPLAPPFALIVPVTLI